jgi:probable HAF family extracellular repeat protein
MALFYECMLKCTQKLLDTADIVREAIYRQLPVCDEIRAMRIDLGFEQAFVWSEAQGIRGLGFLVKGTKPYSGGDALNNVGEVVGCASTEYLGRAFLWSEADGMRDLGTLRTGGNTSCALGINDTGEVVGSSGNTTVHPFLWTRSAGMQDLNSLIPPNSGWVLGSANAINAAGQIVGEGGLNGHGRAFLLTPQASREK